MGLGVVHEHRRTITPGPCAITAVLRQRRAATDSADDSRRLASDVALWGEQHADANIEFVPTLANRIGDPGASSRGRLVDPHHDLVSPDRFGGRERTLENEVGPSLEERLILGRSGLTLGTVDDDGATRPRLAGGRQLPGSRHMRTPPPCKFAARHRAGELVGREHRYAAT